MEYCYVEPKNDELMHYGVKGMHWGIRRYQPYPDGENGQFIGKKSAKKAQKSMNQNSYIYSNAKYMRNKSLNRAENFAIKAEKAHVKGKIKKSNKMLNKAYKELDDADFHKRTMNRAVESIEDTIKKLDKGGYGVSSKATDQILIDRGRMLVGQALLGPIGQILLAPRDTVRKYKVEENPRFGIDNFGNPHPQNKAAKKLNENVQNRGGAPITNIKAPSNNGLLIATTSSQAKKMGLNSNTRVTGKAESDFWKAMAADAIKKDPSLKKQLTKEELRKLGF